MKSKSSRSSRASKRAFTLVEMLVAVTLVLLMMTMFASIFQMATGSVTKQRAISNNDQRVRALSTLIRSDFAHRTFRTPQPFYPGESSGTSVTPFGDRAGYIYISTNDPYSSLDDLIQFTVSSDIVLEDPDGTPYAGKASMLVDRINSTPSVLAINTNQPEADDGSAVINSTGGSNAAEVCYFVRNGNLYRKVMLLRRPLPVAGKDMDEQPTTVRGANFFANADGDFETVANGRSDDFWKHFDYSAIPQFTGTVQSAAFVGASALSNEDIGGPNTSLGNPRFRFGFNFFERDSANNLIPTTGNSREHTSTGNPFFLGRPLHAETSSIRFNWPQQLCEDTSGNVLWPAPAQSPGNPFDVRNGLNLNPATGVVAEFSDGARGGNRRTEDLVLSNVHEFRVEIWDERLQKYTTPGHQERATFRYLDPNTNNLGASTLIGDYHVERMSGLSPVPNTAPYDDARTYGPLVDLNSVGLPPNARVFDTWHPDVNRNQDAQLDAPPFLPYRYIPPAFPDGPSSAFVAVNDTDRITKRTDNRGYWIPNSVMQLGDVVFVPRTDVPPIGEFSYAEIAEPKFSIAYRVVGLQNGGQTHSTPPVFPTAPGKRFREGNNQVEWESIDNRRPLSSVRLTIRFLDPQSESLRQLTLIIPLIDRR